METVNSGTKLINKSDIKRAVGLKGPLGSIIASCAMSFMGLNRINRLYPKFGAFHGKDFTDEAMKTFRISCDILPEELEYIPKEGAAALIRIMHATVKTYLRAYHQFLLEQFDE